MQSVISKDMEVSDWFVGQNNDTKAQKADYSTATVFIMQVKLSQSLRLTYTSL